MQTVHSILSVFQVLVSIALVGLILLQHGKGADAGAAFGSGASATVFGARGSANFLSRATAALALVFFVICLGLAYMAAKRPHAEDVTDSVVDVVEVPVAPAPEGGAQSDDVSPVPAPESGTNVPEDVPAAD
jgi:preprotein translocase subunit SecG